jgi:hypothetical protein
LADCHCYFSGYHQMALTMVEIPSFLAVPGKAADPHHVADLYYPV